MSQPRYIPYVPLPDKPVPYKPSKLDIERAIREAEHPERVYTIEQIMEGKKHISESMTAVEVSKEFLKEWAKRPHTVEEQNRFSEAVRQNQSNV